MLDIVRNGAASAFPSLFERDAGECIAGDASPELALLSRQTQALEYIALQLGQLTSRALVIQPDYEMATRRLLQEAV